MLLFKEEVCTLAGRLSWLEHRPVPQKVVCSIPWSRHIRTLWVPSPVKALTGGNWSVFLSHISASPDPRTNKYILRWGYLKKDEVWCFRSFLVSLNGAGIAQCGHPTAQLYPQPITGTKWADTSSFFPKSSSSSLKFQSCAGLRLSVPLWREA